MSQAYVTRVHNRISAVVIMGKNCIDPWEFSLFVLSAMVLGSYGFEGTVKASSVGNGGSEVLD